MCWFRIQFHQNKSKPLLTLLTHNVGNWERRCSPSAMFRRLHGGGESIVFVTYTTCATAKGRSRKPGFFQQPFKLEQKQSFCHPTRSVAFHLRHPVDIYHLFSVSLSVSGTIFRRRPLAYLRVTVFRLSGLSFTLYTKQISFLLVSTFQS